jgi:ubiquinone/menaquinone biosynthesis C-methylase UbiE
MSELEQKIAQFFDDKSKGRNIIFQDPILKYEQDMRQRAVMELLAPSPGELILDIGCGNARDIILFVQKGTNCVGMDFSRGMLKEGKEDINNLGLKCVDLILADATHLPFKKNIFDKISCSEVIEHIPDYSKAIVEMNRVLKENGNLIITTPNWHSLYGVVRIGTTLIFGRGSKFLRTLRIIKKKKFQGPGHPYDKWKNQKGVVGVMEENGFVLCEKLGVCFIPSQLTYYLPKRLKIAVVKVTSVFENRFRRILTASAYGIAISASKSANRIRGIE